MIDFLRDAPSGALVLFAISLPVLFVASPIKVARLSRRRLEAKEGSPIGESPNLAAFFVFELLGWGLFGLGVLWYVLD